MSQTIEKICKETINHHIDRMHLLCELKKTKDAKALYLELKEWICNDMEHDILHLDFID